MGPKTAEGMARSIANLRPSLPGMTNNPAGRKSAGATMQEWLNSFSDKALTETQVRKIARDENAPLVKRAAAVRFLRMIETGDMADMEPLLNGTMTTEQLREEGVNTEVIKKIKTKTRTMYGDSGPVGTEIEREVELHDRSGVDFDRVFDRTDGKAKQSVDITTAGKPINPSGIDLSKLSAGELRSLRELREKASSPQSSDN